MHKPRKKEAYEIGKQKLLDFADGKGYEKDGAERNSVFKRELLVLFAKAGIGDDD